MLKKTKYLDGYSDSNGNYQWFENTTKQKFVDNNGIKWIRVTGNRNYWNEADTIRIANIRALYKLGINEAHDVCASKNTPILQCFIKKKRTVIIKEIRHLLNISLTYCKIVSY